MRQKSATQFSGVPSVLRSKSSGGAIIAELNVREILEAVLLNVTHFEKHAKALPNILTLLS